MRELKTAELYSQVTVEYSIDLMAYSFHTHYFCLNLFDVLMKLHREGYLILFSTVVLTLGILFGLDLLGVPSWGITIAGVIIE